MKLFIEKYGEKIAGSLSGPDRLMFRGMLRALSTVEGFGKYLNWAGVLLKDFQTYTRQITTRVREAITQQITAEGRPIHYEASPSANKEAIARRYAEKDKIKEGTVALITCVEPCRSFDINRNAKTKMLELCSARRQCLHAYRYLIHPQFGWMHLRLQTWFPFPIQVYINGREWLSRQMDAEGLKYLKRDNCLVWMQDYQRAQELADQQMRANWPQLLEGLLPMIHPLHAELFGGYSYYWTAYQNEYATDISFKDPGALVALYERWLRHGLSHFDSAQVLRFLGRKIPATGNLPPRFEGEVTTRMNRRPEGVCLKHAVDQNSIKMYDKFGHLRIETTMNNPYDFKVFRRTEGHPERPKAWLPLRKGVADMSRRAQVSRAANERYLDALASVDLDPPLKELTDSVSQTVQWKGRRHRGLNLLATEDVRLLSAVAREQFLLAGFRNAHLRAILFDPSTSDPLSIKRQAANITRRIRLLRAHGLVRKIQATNRYMLTEKGRHLVTAILTVRDLSTRKICDKAA